MKRPGFTLVELVIAVALGSMILLAMHTIFASAFRFQAEAQRLDIVRSDVVLSMKALIRDLETATFIQSPASPCGNNRCDGTPGNDSTDTTADILNGYINWDPVLAASTGDGRLDSSRNALMFHYCIVNNQLCRVTGAPGPVPGGNCCTTAGRMIIADRITRDDQGRPYFLRPAFTNNHVELHYAAEQPQPAASRPVRAIVNTSVTMRGPRTTGQ